MKIASLFAGAGGLDLGFKQAGFDIVFANEFDKKIWATYEKNHPETILSKKDIRDLTVEDIPNGIDGIIGGPPCQSWSEAGNRKGIDDDRGKLFLEYVRLLNELQPYFFIAENVRGMMAKRNSTAVQNILQLFDDANYDVFIEQVNANDFNVPQDRKRVIYIGFRKDLKVSNFNLPILLNQQKLTLKDAIYDLKDNVVPAKAGNKTNKENCNVMNHEYFEGGYSSMYMSRNRVRSWDEPSFTIQASGRQAPQHPQTGKMIKEDKDKFIFNPTNEHLIRRLSIRECARIQTFPDDFEFVYENLNEAYKMIGNAVPVELAKFIGKSIIDKISELSLEEKIMNDSKILSNSKF